MHFSMKLIFVPLLFLFCAFACKKATPLPSLIIQHNYFDSTFYKMKEVDTNKVEMRLYQAVFKKISLNTTSKCLLLRIHFTGIISDEIGLYDYGTQNFYYWSVADNNLYKFRKSDTDESKQLYERMKKYINNPEKALEDVKSPSLLMDGGHFMLSLITVKSKEQIDVKAFYWL